MTEKLSAFPAPKFEGYPFAFVGAGEAGYFEWAEVHVLFQRAPSSKDQAVISERVPPPLRDSIDFDGRHLVVASGQFVHTAMMEAYEKAPDDSSEDTFEDGFGFAANSKVSAFNADIEQWLRAAHEQCPIAAAYRAQDWEAGGTELSDWHRWTMAHPERLLASFDGIDVEADPAGFMLRGILRQLAQAEVRIPDAFRDVIEPGWREIEALQAGDEVKLRDTFARRSARFDAAISALIDATDLDDERQMDALLGIAPAFSEHEPSSRAIPKLARIAALRSQHPERDVVLEAILESARANSYTRSHLGVVAWKLLSEDFYPASWAIFDRLVELDGVGNTTFNNALYAVMNDNHGLGVDEERMRRYLARCLPHGEKNPGIFYNAACLYKELGQLDEVYSNIEKALRHGYEKPNQIREEGLFADIADEPRFIALFEAEHG